MDCSNCYHFVIVNCRPMNWIFLLFLYLHVFLDILHDPAIPRLLFEEIEVKKVIGKGASGLVSSGIWKPKFVCFFCFFSVFLTFLSRDGPELEIALKELLLGVQDLGFEALEEFLMEIKFMRFGN